MTSDRLSQIEKSLKRLYKQLDNKQKALDTIESSDKKRIRQQIEHLRQDEIQPLEAEHRQILVAASEQLQILEPEAEIIVGEIVTGVNQLEAQPPSLERAEVLPLLREILNRVNEPDKPASLRVKGIFSTFPPFVGLFIEPEIGLTSFLQRHFPTFIRVIRGAAKK